MPKEDGQFKKGQSGNPSGRPKVNDRVKELAREHTEEAILALVEEMKEKKGAARVAAATALLDRGYGKPTQTIDANVSILDQLRPEELAALEQAIAAIIGFDDEGNQEAVN